jgi:hypothetical protein
MTIKIALPVCLVCSRRLGCERRSFVSEAIVWVVALILSLLASCAAVAQSSGSSSLDKKLESTFAAFRIGVIATPVASVDTGLDVTFPQLHIGRAWVTRFDLDLSARFNSRSFGSRRDAEIAVALCQVYTPGGINRGRYFVGAGIGPSFGPRSGLAGKVFAGLNFTPVVSLELEGQFPPDSAVRLTAMLRLSAL